MRAHLRMSEKSSTFAPKSAKLAAIDPLARDLTLPKCKIMHYEKRRKNR